MLVTPFYPAQFYEILHLILLRGRRGCDKERFPNFKTKFSTLEIGSIELSTMSFHLDVVFNMVPILVYSLNISYRVLPFGSAEEE